MASLVDAMDQDEDLRVGFHVDSLTNIGFSNKDYCKASVLDEAEKTGLGSLVFRRLLSDLLTQCGPSITPVNPRSTSFTEELVAQLSQLDFPGTNIVATLESLEKRQDLIDFLIAEVQIYRIIQAKKEDNDLMDTDEEIHRPPERIMSKMPSKKLSVKDKLQAICRTIQIEFLEDPAVCLNAIVTKITQLHEALPANYDGKLLWVEQLTAADLQTLRDINDAFKEDYAGRREMMLKRLDVTLQTLLWSDRAKPRMEEMSSIIETHKAHILAQGQPEHVVLEIFASQDDLAAVNKTSSSSSLGGTSLASVLMLDVVDRGGRVGEKRRAKDMPAFVARSQAAPKHSTAPTTQPNLPQGSSSSNTSKAKERRAGDERRDDNGRGGRRKRGKHH